MKKFKMKPEYIEALRCSEYGSYEDLLEGLTEPTGEAHAYEILGRHKRYIEIRNEAEGRDIRSSLINEIDKLSGHIDDGWCDSAEEEKKVTLMILAYRRAARRL